MCQLPNLGENTYLQVRKLRSGTPQLATRRRVFTWLYEDEIWSVEGPGVTRVTGCEMRAGAAPAACAGGF